MVDQLHLGMDETEQLIGCHDRASGLRAVVAIDDPSTMSCDVLAPCAGAKVIDRSVVPALQCRIVAGGANDVLATHDVATLLADRGIVYMLHFVINAGGVIHIHALRSAWGLDKLEGSLLAVGDRVATLIREADRSGRTPVAVAEEMVSHRLGRPIALPT